MIRLIFYGLLGWAAYRIVEENRRSGPIPLPAPRRKGPAAKAGS